jgi:hypothetical protein
MIVVNKPNNFYWEYVCYFEQKLAGVSIISSVNNTLGTITASRNSLGEARFTISPSLFATNKTYVQFTCTNSNHILVTFDISVGTSSISIIQNDGTSNKDGFDGYLSIKIYP